MTDGEPTYLAQVRDLLDADPGLAQELDEIVEIVGCTRRTAEEYVRMWRNAPGPFALESAADNVWMLNCEECSLLEECRLLMEVTNVTHISMPVLCEAVTESDKQRYEQAGAWQLVLASRKLVRNKEKAMGQKTMNEAGLEALCAKLLHVLEHEPEEDDPDKVWELIEDGWEQIGGRDAWEAASE